MQKKYKILISVAIILVVVPSGVFGVLFILRSDFYKNYATWRGHGWRVREVEFSPVDPILATGSSDGSVRLWNTETGETLHVLSRHHYGVIALAFSPSGKILASGGYDNKINLWNVSSGEHIETFTNYPMGVTDLKWLPDEESLVVAGGEYMGYIANHSQPEKYLQIMNTSDSGNVLKQFIGHTESVMSISISSDGSRLLSGSMDSTVRVWDIETGNQMQIFQDHTDIITSVLFSNDQSSFISASLDGTVKLWNNQSSSVVNELNTELPIWSISQSSQTNELAIAVDSDLHWQDVYFLTFGSMHDCSIQIWNLEKSRKIDTLKGHENTIESVKFSPNGKFLASVSWDWTVKLWGKHSKIQITEEIDAWITALPSEVGIDKSVLDDGIDSIINGIISSTFHSILVVKDSKLVYERYFLDENEQDFTVTTKHVQFSATKSFTSALIGIAIDKGFINSTDDKFLDYFPEYSGLSMDSRVEDITIEHLLTMTSGLNFDDSYSDIWYMAVVNDSLEYILTRTMYGDPGASHIYNSGSSQLLSALITKTTNQSTYDFALQYLFEPLGMDRSDVIWVSSSDGIYHGGIGLFMTPRNMAKFGQLYLNNGTWEGDQIISEEWIYNSTIDFMASTPTYGYHFWIEENRYSARGYGGQMIIVVPEHDLVIVTTARAEHTRALTIPDLVIDALIS